VKLKEEPGVLDATDDDVNAVRVRQSGVDDKARSLVEPVDKIEVVCDMVETVI
jgi:hypothetical protein